MFPIEVKELRKEYPTARVLSDGRRAAPAVDRLSFQVAAGEVFSLLGPNGAGKTTTVKMLCTLLSPPPETPPWPGTASWPTPWESERA